MNNIAKLQTRRITFFLILLALILFINSMYVLSGLGDDNDSNKTECDNYLGMVCDGVSCYNSTWTWEYLNDGEYYSSCCGDDSSEFYTNRSADSSMDNSYSSLAADRACCDNANDCIDEGICYNSTDSVDADSDSDYDYCYQGIWFDCSSDLQCSEGYNCLSNDCVDITSPVNPRLWAISDITTSSTEDIIGYLNESGMNVSVDVVSESFEVAHYYDYTIISSGYIWQTTTTTSKLNGSNKITIPDTFTNKNNFTSGRYIELSNHNKTYFSRYHINRQDDIGNELQLNLSENLESDVPIGTVVRVYNSSYPSGWFNVTISLFSGNNTISVQGKDNQDNEGSASYLYITYDISDPEFNLSMIESPTGTRLISFNVMDNYQVNISSLSVNVTLGISSYLYTYNNNISCSGQSKLYTCNLSFAQDEGSYNLTFNVDDFIGRTNTSYFNNFTLDENIEFNLEVNDSGEITANKNLSAIWTEYTDSITSLDHYEYAVGIAVYPNSGWNNLIEWTNTTSNSVTTQELDLVHGQVYYFNVRVLNDAGIYSNVSSSDGIVYIDNTPPLMSSLLDSGAYTSTNTELYARWNATDEESGISEYEIAIGTAPYPQTGWYTTLQETVSGSITEKTYTELDLEQNRTYYFTVRAKNGYGAWSQRNSSNGITVDITSPGGGDINYTAGTYTTNIVTLNFSQGQDNESGIKNAELWYARSEYSSNSCTGNYLFENFIADVTGTSGYEYTMGNGYCYKFMLRVYNNANLSNEYYYYSDLLNQTVIVDTTPPADFNITDDGAVTYDGTRLHAEWTQSSDHESGLNRYEYRIQYTFNNGPRINLINWTNIGLTTSITEYFDLNHSNLSHQYKYYFDVRAISNIGLNTTKSSDGIIYMDIYPPQTALLSVGEDTTYSYTSENFGNITINVSGEQYMKCVYSEDDIDYSDSEEECTTYGSIASCLINLSGTGNYTYHIICSDIHGNGQDFDENIDVSFYAYVFDSIVQSVSLSSEEVISVKYTNASGYLYSQGSSSTEINSTIFSNYLYYVKFANNASKFSATLQNVNISDNPLINITAKYVNVSQLNNSNISLGPAERYIPRDAYAIEIQDNFNGTYLAEFNYTNINLSNENALMIYKLGFDFSNNQTNYTDYTLYSGVTRDAANNIVSASINGFSLFVLVEDSQMQETCGDGIDNDGDGSVDEGCSSPGGNPGGSSSSSSSDDESTSRRSSGGPPVFETCYDNELNQDETDVDCGGICAGSRILKKCALGKNCEIDTDCGSSHCNPGSKVCYVPSCSDGLKNQDEAGIDCGGQCDACPTCNDGIQNQGEEGIDCGGPCDACLTCNDGIQNQGETGIDCGGSCRACATCDDNLRNQGEEDIDCGGPCGPCPEIEEPAQLPVFIPILFGIIMLGITITGLYLMQVSKTKAKQAQPEEAVPTGLEEEEIKPEKPLKKEINLKREITHPVHPVEITDAMLLKLQNYANTLAMHENSKDKIRLELDSLGWPEYIVDIVITNIGDVEYMKKLFELQDYIDQHLKGFTHDEIRKRLRPLKWQDKDVDLVLNKANIVSSKDSLNKYILYQLVKDIETDKIEDTLFNAGWPKSIVNTAIFKLKTRIKSDQKEIEGLLMELFNRGMSEKQAKQKLLEKGYSEDVVDLLIFTKFSEKKHLEELRDYINMRLIKGDKSTNIKKTLVNARWGIDIIDEIINENFKSNDIKYLVALDSYIREAFAKGYTKKIITNDLLKKKWADEYIDMVMLKVHVIDDKLDKIKKYINLRLGKGDSREKITELLVRVGWGRKIVEDVFGNKK
ncbi:fibronectin type III domain-containing protein [Candidatus Woesearchaeota archaeon]|nr:fibronectin type III domain-containing protein [Candidatus Woesearchaeota archaeon]